MSKHCVVNVATGDHYLKGQARLVAALAGRENRPALRTWQRIPGNWPSHADEPYAFKAYALQHVADLGYTKLLWCDACIVPTGPLDRIWAYAAEHGAWMSHNGYSNYTWTADSAYPDLFPELTESGIKHIAREVNRGIPHVVATAFALDLHHPNGRAFLAEYYRLASETRAFCGPWTNSRHRDWNLGQPVDTHRVAPCGPEDVRGHRHDQTAASVIAWRLGIPLTDPPDFFAYPPGDERTLLLADGNY